MEIAALIIVGLPMKGHIEKPIFDYEMRLAIVLDKLRSRQFTIKQIVSGNTIQ